MATVKTSMAVVKPAGAKVSARKTRRKETRYERTTRRIIVAALFLCVAALSVAFAAMATDLVVDGVSKISGANWSIDFGSASATPAGGAKASASKTAATTVSFSVEFTHINQSADVVWTAENSGNIDAKIADITSTGLSDLAPKKINYTLSYADGTPVAAGDVLAAGSSRTMKLHLDYVATYAEWLAQQGAAVATSIKFSYVQL
jgi:hypothetical protein